MIFAKDLTWILFLPTVGALAVMATPVRWARWVALAFAAVVFVLAMAIFFRVAANGYNFGDLNHPADVVQTSWIRFKAGNVQFNIDYFLGVDGLSLPMVILNALLTLLAVVGGWKK